MRYIFIIKIELELRTMLHNLQVGVKIEVLIKQQEDSRLKYRSLKADQVDLINFERQHKFYLKYIYL